MKRKNINKNIKNILCICAKFSSNTSKNVRLYTKHNRNVTCLPRFSALLYSELTLSLCVSISSSLPFELDNFFFPFLTLFCVCLCRCCCFSLSLVCFFFLVSVTFFSRTSSSPASSLNGTFFSFHFSWLFFERFSCTLRIASPDSFTNESFLKQKNHNLNEREMRR